MASTLAKRAFLGGGSGEIAHLPGAPDDAATEPAAAPELTLAGMHLSDQAGGPVLLVQIRIAAPIETLRQLLARYWDEKVRQPMALVDESFRQRREYAEYRRVQDDLRRTEEQLAVARRELERLQLNLPSTIKAGRDAAALEEQIARRQQEINRLEARVALITPEFRKELKQQAEAALVEVKERCRRTLLSKLQQELDGVAPGALNADKLLESVALEHLLAQLQLGHRGVYGNPVFDMEMLGPPEAAALPA